MEKQHSHTNNPSGDRTHTSDSSLRALLSADCIDLWQRSQSCVNHSRQRAQGATVSWSGIQKNRDLQLDPRPNLDLIYAFLQQKSLDYFQLKTAFWTWANTSLIAGHYTTYTYNTMHNYFILHVHLNQWLSSCEPQDDFKLCRVRQKSWKIRQNS